MYNPYIAYEQSDDSSRKPLAQPTEHVAAMTVATDTMRGPLPQRSFSTVGVADLPVQEGTYTSKLDRVPAWNSQRGVASPTSAGFGNQNLFDPPKPGHWNKDRRGGIHLGSIRFPHPHFSNRLSIFGANGLSSEVTGRGGAYDARTAAEQDRPMTLEEDDGSSSLQRWHSTSSSDDDGADDQRGRETKSNILTTLRHRNSEPYLQQLYDHRYPEDRFTVQELKSSLNSL
jgi:hypothetical protein